MGSSIVSVPHKYNKLNKHELNGVLKNVIFSYYISL